MICKNELNGDGRIPAKIIYMVDEIDMPPVHWHSNFEVDYICTGHTFMKIDGEVFSSSGECGCIVSGGSLHVIWQDGRRRIDGLAIVFMEDYIRKYYPEIEASDFEKILNPQKSPELFAVLRSLYKIYHKDSMQEDFDNDSAREFTSLRIHAYLNLILYYLLTDYRVGEKSVISNQAKIIQKNICEMLDYINIHFKENLSQNAMAEQLGISREHFARVFKKYVGLSCGEYISYIRLLYGFKLLVETQESLLNIALQSGFPDSRAFSRVFAHFYHCSPAEYRQKIQQGKVEE